MIAVVHDVAQRSPEWHALRCGRLTGTGAADMVATIKKGEASARRDLRTRLVVERLTGISSDQNGYKSLEMQWGIDHEDDARHAYEAETGRVVRQAGFLAHPEYLAGCSPDGLVGADGVLEIKAPKSATHLTTLRSRTVPADYVPQLQHALWITGRAWCDFVSYDPRFPEPLQLVIVRFGMTDAERQSYGLVVRLFLDEVARELDEVQSLIPKAA